MDVFKLDQSLNANLGNAPPPDKINAEVSFDAGSEFHLSFFDPPEESTQGFSDPGSVGSTSVASPSPDVSSPQVATSTYPVVLQQASSSVASSPSPSSKQGISSFLLKFTPENKNILLVFHLIFSCFYVTSQIIFAITNLSSVLVRKLRNLQ